MTAGKVMRGRGLNAVLQNEAWDMRPWKIFMRSLYVFFGSGRTIS